ncbi:antitoxin [Knoellia locipacati]|uniref:antitoxin n=1 Tax=Knoellia locipacati TaxID=882824 RepID=UPI0038505958
MARGVIKLAALAGLAKQARDYAQKNPDSVSSAIAKVESAVRGKVGPKYAGHVGKGGNAVRSGLGIAHNRPAPGASLPRTDEPVTPPPAPPTP